MQLKIEFIFILLISVVAIFSLFFMFEINNITGLSAKRLNNQYVNCAYIDNDNFGVCVRIEQQQGIKCTPPSDYYDYLKAHDFSAELLVCGHEKNYKYFG